MELPAGLLPEDCNIEFFANPNEFGKCYWLQYVPFHELQIETIVTLYRELFLDRNAVQELKSMGITKDNEMVEQYNFCNRGKLDSTPDITESGKFHKEYFDCGRHGKCPGEGNVCSLYGLTLRERQCLELNGQGKSYKEIRAIMGFKNQTPVNSLMSRCRSKLDARNKTDLLVKSRLIGIIV